jgi:glutathione S-transferase
MLTVWGRRTASNVQALMWGIGELGLDYVRHDVGGRFGGKETAEFGALNPNRTLPVLRDGDQPAIWETGAILRYLASTYVDDEFWPADTRQRANVDMWAEWAKINVAMAFTVPVFWRVVRAPEAERDWPAIRQAVEAVEAKLHIAEDRLSRHAFLAGDSFTLPDIQFGHVLYRYFDIDIERADLPAVRAYHARLLQRPAYVEHVAISYDELRAD